jgi:hypothetical protein
MKYFNRKANVFKKIIKINSFYNQFNSLKIKFN